MSRRSRERPNKRAMNWDETPRTGWDHELMQDESSALSQWFASQPNARAHVRDAAALIEQQREQQGAKQ